MIRVACGIRLLHNLQDFVHVVLIGRYIHLNMEPATLSPVCKNKYTRHQLFSIVVYPIYLVLQSSVYKTFYPDYNPTRNIILSSYNPISKLRTQARWRSRQATHQSGLQGAAEAPIESTDGDDAEVCGVGACHGPAVVAQDLTAMSCRRAMHHKGIYREEKCMPNGCIHVH